MKRSLAPVLLLSLGFASAAPAQPPGTVLLAEADKNSFCLNYAGRAISQNQDARHYECDKSGGRWSYNRFDHHKWCMAVDRAEPDRETRIRDQELRACMFPTGVWTDGPGSSRARWCRDYSARALRQVADAARHNCKFSGPRWSHSYKVHFDWCKPSRDTTVLAEGNRRDSELAGCKSARRR
jgi:hypothetical protein